jgi:hypothetical protein
MIVSRHGLMLGLLGSVAFGLISTVALGAPLNAPAPTGPVVLDLAGQTIPTSYTTYTVNFTATSSITDLSFAFRDDPGYLFLDNVVLTSVGGGTNLVTNGDFEQGPVGTDAHGPVGWHYVNVYQSSFAGYTEAGVGHPGNAYNDGSVQSYDAITQSIATIANQSYTLSFDLSGNQNGANSIFRSVSDNGGDGTNGNGIDLIVYAGNGVPAPGVIPLPGSAPMFGGGLLVLGLAGYRASRRKSVRTA